MGKGKAKSKAKIKQKQKTARKSKNVVKKQKPVLRKQSLSKGSPQKPSYSIVLGQINTLVGDVHENARKVIAVIEKAKEQGAQLVVFPELTLTSCPPKDLLLRPDFVDVNMQRFIEVVNACKGISCVFGFVNKANKNLYNAIAFVKDQKILGIQNKV
ncbi:MAG: nitrilase-related carbon-nitrogen hydrolase, partial [Nanoarchaeota archaeon]